MIDYTRKAKIKDSNEWVIGYHVYVDYLDKHYILVSEKTHDGFIGMLAMNQYEVDGDTICNPTGLTDKNGNKIWENDIIATDCGNVRVIYSAEPSPFENSFYVGFEVLFPNITDNENYRHDLGYWSVMRGFEVIGNIFDNADLLKGE